jgi:signal transduction histidine kinase
MPAIRSRRLVRYGIALGATAVAFAARWAMIPLVPDGRYPFFTFAIALILVAWHAGFGPSVVTFVTGYLVGTWFFVPPKHSFLVVDTTAVMGSLSFVIISAIVIMFARSMHLARERADAHARQAIQHQKQLEAEVCERKRAEEEVRRLNTGLEERVRQRTAELVATNKELEAFTYSVSHDLRAPLRHVDGYAQILQEEYGKELTPGALKYATKIRLSSQNMGKLVDDLLNLSKIGKTELKRHAVALNPLVDEVLASLKPEINGRQIEWRIGKLPTVECDAGLARVVLSNLLGNAAKYTRPRELATIEVDQIEVDGESVIRVRDNGVGFNMKYADKLFGVFQRLHRTEEFEGTGVGLATVQRIINKHGGRIWAEAEVNKGATFYFTMKPRVNA